MSRWRGLIFCLICIFWLDSIDAARRSTGRKAHKPIHGRDIFKGIRQATHMPIGTIEPKTILGKAEDSQTVNEETKKRNLLVKLENIHESLKRPLQSNFKYNPEFELMVSLLSEYPSLQAAILKLPLEHHAKALKKLAELAQRQGIWLSTDMGIGLPNRYDSKEGYPNLRRPQAKYDGRPQNVNVNSLEVALHQYRTEVQFPGIIVKLTKPEMDKIRYEVSRHGENASTDISTPTWEFLGIEKLIISTRFTESFDKVLSILPSTLPKVSNRHADLDARLKDPVLFIGNEINRPTNELLPGRFTARAFDNTGQYLEQHANNLRGLTKRTFDPKKTMLFNLLPEHEQIISQFGLSGSAKQWKKLKKSFHELAGEIGVKSVSAPAKQALLKAWAKQSMDTIIIVAHGDRNSIYLSDGTSISTTDISNLRVTVRSPPPMVVLVSCETGKPDLSGIRSIAQALVAKGLATAVLAPMTEIPGNKTSLQFVRELFESGDAGDAPKAFSNLSGPWQIYVELLGNRIRHVLTS